MHGRKLVTTGTVAAFAIFAVIGGCRDATTGPTSVKPQDFASNLKLLSGNEQTGAVGAALPEVLSVRVVDAGGQPVAGATVLWQVRSGGGTINPPASTSSSSGLATVTWTLGTTLGANKVVAQLQGSYVLDSVVFNATAKVGPAQKLTAASGNLQSGRVASALTQPLVVNVKDQFNFPVSGVKVTWAPGAFSGSVVAASDTTDATGNASATWTLGTAAIGQSATATITGLAPIVFNATATVDTSRVITAGGGSGQTALAGSTLATPITVNVKDRFGNIIVGDTVIFNDSISAGGRVGTVLGVTDALGNASSTWTLGQLLGPQVVRARTQRGTRLTFTATSTAQFTQVYTGNFFSCGVTTGDRAFCWGFGEDGQRGVSSLKSSNAATAAVTTADTLAGPFPTFRQISAGTSYICGVSIARQLYCWGRLASAVQFSVPTLKSFNNVLSFSTVSTSDTHSCLITTAGVLACTGSNSQGQLGDGTQTDQKTDYVVAANAAPLTGQRWSAVSVGGQHTCAFMQFNPNTAAPAPTDSANTSVPWCWGANGSGQLGHGGALSQNSLVPTRIGSGVMPAFDSTSLVSGALHSCALSRAGVPYCWGSNAYGQLGKAITGAARDSLPQAVALPTGVTAFTKLFAGEYHTCGITTTGSAYCWGRNSSGQLGDGTVNNSATPVLVTGGLSWRSLALGELHTCGVANASGSGSGTQAGAGVLYCWGDNEYGQVGIGTNGANGVPVLAPTKVSGQP